MSKTRIDVAVLNEILQRYYPNKATMAKALGISRSHLQTLFQGKGAGELVINGLMREGERLGFNAEHCFIPEPIMIGNLKVSEINICDANGELLASISSRDIIEKKGTTVILVKA